MRSFLKIITTIACLLILAGCATPYGPNGFTGGYREKKIAEGKYIVSFFGNGNTNGQMVWNYWIYRCAELTLANGYDYFELSPSTEHAYLDGVEQPYQFSMIEAPVQQNDNLSKNVYYYYQTVTTYSSKAIVTMFKNPVPDDNDKVLFGAQSIVTQLKPYVESAGSVAPPDKKDLFIRATVEAAIKMNRIRQEEADLLEKHLRKNM